MNSLEKLVKALRCSSSTGADRAKDCKNCPYRWLEPIHSEIPIPSDVCIDGIEYWETCDCDQMAKDAANVIEKYMGK